MPTYADLKMPPPRSWDEFEAITCSAAKNRWSNPNFTRHGRQGQKQDGVDIYGNDGDGHLVALQCKNTVQGLTAAIINDEVTKAEAFRPAVTYLFIATTAETDRELQLAVRKLSAAREARGEFGIDILFWTDIWQDLTRDESRLFQHYPELRPREAEPISGHDAQLFQEFQKVFPFEPAVRLLRDHDFGGPFLKRSIQPLYDFVETWDGPEKEFLDEELQTALAAIYEASRNMAHHLVETTVPVGNMEYASVFSDAMRARGPRPSWVVEEARNLNQEAAKFVPIYEQFLRLCRRKLMR